MTSWEWGSAAIMPGQQRPQESLNLWDKNQPITDTIDTPRSLAEQFVQGMKGRNKVFRSEQGLLITCVCTVGKRNRKILCVMFL